MKVIIATTLLVVLALAEPPPAPSHSYLPPSSRSQQGYSQGPPSGYAATAGPQIVAARTLGQGRGAHDHGPHGAAAQGNDFARSGLHAHGSLGARGRNSQSGYPSGDQGYDQNASPFGRNALDDANPTVSYEADERGFKPHISYEDADSDSFGRSGYDSNANNLRQNGGSHHGNSFGNHGNARNGGY
ncbi:pro-resilin-like isoform X2 [Plodia interpunctella]|uniref:pro-resilin-like isoform X2 n=1 Tax=Plodia interpunctella TaxID=58824 RepID=UPI0023676E2D|nr:pro-resilin-like isoform X2 [Plodia interpunctella]